MVQSGRFAEKVNDRRRPFYDRLTLLDLAVKNSERICFRAFFARGAEARLMGFKVFDESFPEHGTASGTSHIIDKQRCPGKLQLTGNGVNNNKQVYVVLWRDCAQNLRSDLVKLSKAPGLWSFMSEHWALIGEPCNAGRLNEVVLDGQPQKGCCSFGS